MSLNDPVNILYVDILTRFNSAYDRQDQDISEELVGLQKKIADFAKKVIAVKTEPQSATHIATDIQRLNEMESTVKSCAQAISGLSLRCLATRPLENQFMGLAKMVLGSHFDETHMTRAFEQMKRLGDHYENHTQDLIEHFQKQGISIPLDIGGDLPAEKREFLNQFLMDTLLMTCIHPCKIDARISGLPSHIATIAPFCFDELTSFLKDQDRLVEHPYVQNINQAEYGSYSIEQKIFALTTAKVGSGEDRPQDQEIYKKLLTYPGLTETLFTSSFMTTQTHLNSCTLASINQRMLTQLSSVPALLYLTKKRIAALESEYEILSPELRDAKIFKNSWGFGGVSRGEHIKHIIEIAKTALVDAEQKMVSHIEKGSLQSGEVRKFLKVWNKSAQRLGSITNFFDMAYLSKKPVKNNWLASAALMIVPGVVGGLVANYPSVKDRLNGMGVRDLQKIKDFYGDFLTLKSERSCDLGKCMEDLHGPLTEQLVEDLWQPLFASKGVYLSVGAHSAYLRALKVEGERKFAIAEVKGAEYIIMNPQEFRVFLQRNPNYFFRET